MKKKKLPNVIGGFDANSPFFFMNWNEFVEFCGGRVAIALFNGRVREELSMCISMAHARGMKHQLESEE